MHILMLPSWYPQGEGEFHGSFFREQAEALVQAGHQVGVISVTAASVLDRGAFRAATALRAAPAQENGVTVWRGAALRPIPFAHRLNAQAIARRWERYFVQYVAQHGRPDVLHAHAMNPGGVAAARIAKRHGIPFVVTEHRAESSIEELGSPRLAALLRNVACEAAALIAVSPGFASQLSQVYAPLSWESIPNLLPAQFAELEPARQAADPFVFGCVSNLTPMKRVDRLIEAFAEAFGNSPAVQLRIAGDSEHRSELERVAEQLGLSNVLFVGSVPRQDIAAEFAHYDAFVLPSTAESFGVVFWEALAAGLPLIATNTDGGRYAVRPETGLLVEIDDHAALVQALRTMRETAGQYDRAAIRRISIDEAGAKTFTQRYTEVYRDAINESH